MAASYVSAGAQSLGHGFFATSTGTWPAFMGLRQPESIANLTKFGCRARMGFGRLIEVSEEFKTKVLDIAKLDDDVQRLLKEGYEVADVRPILSIRVEANGDVVTKATAAVVTLKKNTTSLAKIWVDLTNNKVVRIVISTRTVIDKS